MIRKYKMTEKELEIKKQELAKAEKELVALNQRYAMSRTLGTDYDTGTNSESLQTYQEFEPIYQRINELKDEICNVEIVEVTNDGTVGYGAVVVIRCDNGEEEKLFISSTKVSNENLLVCTPSSPLYACIEGKKKGYKGTCKYSSNKVNIEYDFEILDVYYPVSLEKK